MKNEAYETGKSPIKKRKKADFFRIVDISAISFVVLIASTIPALHFDLEWFWLPAVIGLFVWTYYTAKMVFAYRHTDEYESTCFSRAAAAVILAMVAYVIIVGFLGHLAFEVFGQLTHNETALAISNNIQEEDILFEIAMATFYATFYWVRNRGYAG